MSRKKNAFIAILLSIVFTISSGVGSPITLLANEDDDAYQYYYYEEYLDEHEQQYIEMSEQKISMLEAIYITLGEPLGMQNFDDIYYLDDQMVEISVQFRTPPSVALGYLLEQDEYTYLGEDYFNEMAMEAHAAFIQQLEDIYEHVEILSEHYRLFNGVFMNIPADMISMVSELPEVFAVFPNANFLQMDEDALEDEYDYALTDEYAYDDYYDYASTDDEYTYDDDYDYASTDDEYAYENYYEYTSMDEYASYDYYDSDKYSLSDLLYVYRSQGFTGAGVRLALPAYENVFAISPDVEILHMYLFDHYGQSNAYKFTNALEEAHAAGVDIINIPLFEDWPPLNDMMNIATLDGTVLVETSDQAGVAALMVQAYPYDTAYELNERFTNFHYLLDERDDEYKYESVTRFTVDNSENAAPFIDARYDRTMVSLETLLQTFENASIEWQADTASILIVTNPTHTLYLDTPLPDGMGTPMVDNDTVFLPLRYVAELLGANVRWDSSSRAVYVYQ